MRKPSHPSFLMFPHNRQLGNIFRLKAIFNRRFYHRRDGNVRNSVENSSNFQLPTFFDFLSSRGTLISRSIDFEGTTTQSPRGPCIFHGAGEAFAAPEKPATSFRWPAWNSRTLVFRAASRLSIFVALSVLFLIVSSTMRITNKYRMLGRLELFSAARERCSTGAIGNELCCGKQFFDFGKQRGKHDAQRG